MTFKIKKMVILFMYILSVITVLTLCLLTVLLFKIDLAAVLMLSVASLVILVIFVYLSNKAYIRLYENKVEIFNGKSKKHMICFSYSEITKIRHLKRLKTLVIYYKDKRVILNIFVYQKNEKLLSSICSYSGVTSL